MLREERYDAVIHLHSTAIGAEDYYTLSNNQARREGLQQAAELDQKIAAVWTGGGLGASGAVWPGVHPTERGFFFLGMKFQANTY